MQCPACGYDGIAEEASFCPNCRHPFRETESDVIFESPPQYLPEPRPARKSPKEKLTRKEMLQFEVQLLQPAVILMLALAAVFYLSSGRIAELSVSVLSSEIRYGGVLCLIAGAVIAWIFYRIMLWRVQS
jgi:hypothetical protein